MANNYLQFSEQLKIPSSEALSWVVAQLDLAGLEQTPPRTYDWQRDEQCLAEDSNGFEWKVETDRESSHSLWIYSADYGNPDSVSGFVQAFLRRFSPHAVWTMTYSLTCSKLRVGEFSGGAVVVTAEAIESLDAGCWAAEMAQHNQQLSAGST